jgi:phosphoribosylanthranilate isomerase
MFHVKICGITNVGDALLAAHAGADAVGLNFYHRSPRFIPFELARQIVAALPKEVTKVGLFVDAAAADVCRAFDDLGLDLVQLHGNEPPEYLPQLGSRPVMRAFRLSSDGLEPITEYLVQCHALHAMPQRVLLDAHVPGQYGGTGQTTDWSIAAEYARLSAAAAVSRREPDAVERDVAHPSEGRAPYPPLVLAGGLTPANVAEAIRTIRPAAVDTASGVESSRGHKNLGLVEAFVKAAREGLEV